MSSASSGRRRFADAPKLLGNAEAREERLKQLQEPHVAPLTAFVEQLRVEAGPGAGIPYFDPWDAGINAETLFLLEAPGPKAVLSGFVSRNNPDETAKNMFDLCREASLDRRKTTLWNAVPWYIGSGTKIRAATPADLEAGLKPLPRLLALLPNLRSIVLVGKKAEKATAQLPQRQYAIFKCPHPSPLFVNNAPENRDKILAILRQVRESSVNAAA